MIDLHALGEENNRDNLDYVGQRNSAYAKCKSTSRYVVTNTKPLMGLKNMRL